MGCDLTWSEWSASGSQHAVAAHLKGLGEVQVVEDEQVPRGSGDEHLGTIRRQTHPHQVAGVEELFVRAAVLCEPATSCLENENINWLIRNSEGLELFSLGQW